MENGRTAWAQEPEIHQAPDFLEINDFTTDGSTTIPAELATVAGPFALQAEWKNGWFDYLDGENWEGSGAYVEASYFLTGESRSYNTAAGVFGRVSPIRPLDFDAGDYGAWQIALRYSWIDLRDGSTNGGEEQVVTAALSWHLYSNVRIQLNYTYADINASGDVLSNATGHIHAFHTRAQLEF